MIVAGPMTLRHPPGERDHRAQRQQVGRRDPLDRGERDVQLAAQRLQRHVDDRRVEDRHDGADKHHKAHAPDGGVDAIGLSCGVLGNSHEVPKG